MVFGVAGNSYGVTHPQVQSSEPPTMGDPKSEQLLLLPPGAQPLDHQVAGHVHDERKTYMKNLTTIVHFCLY